MLTRCPACQTVFRLRPEQLHARRGEVRCGHCFHPFNAIEHALQLSADDTPAAPRPTPDFYILEDKPAPTTGRPSSASMLDFGIPEPEPEPEPPFTRQPYPAAWKVDNKAEHEAIDPLPANHKPESTSALPVEQLPHPSTATSTASQPTTDKPTETALPNVFPGVLRSGRRPAPPAESHPADAEVASPIAFEIPATPPPILASEPPPHEPTPQPATAAQDAASHAPDLARLDATYGRPPQRAHPAIRALGWLLVLALAALLGAQTTYLYRMEIARELPGLRPLLTQACAHAKCTIPYPQEAERIAIEASDLQAEPGKPGHYLLHATLNNRAEYPQRWPHLELTLTDAGDNPISRRVLAPAEWLSADQGDEAFPARKAVELRLPFEVPGLAPTGYRIYAFYP